MNTMSISTMTRSLKSLVIALFAAATVLVAFGARPAKAAQTGALEGYVVDDSGLPIQGARVILTSPQMIGGAKTAVTDAEGKFRYSQLAPGKYTVEISHRDFTGFKEEDIEVGIGAQVIKDYLLEPAAKVDEGEQPVIKVTAAAPMVDTTKVSEGISIRPEFTDRTATSRTYQGVALFTPGVVDGATAPGNASIHGGTPFSNVYLLDGLNITDPSTQTFSTNFNFDAIGELQILTGGLDAEYGSTLGGIQNIVTKSGGDDFTLDGSVYWSPKELILTDPNETIDSNSVDANLTVGGPIIKKKLWFLASGQYTDSTFQSQLPSGQSPIFPGVDTIPPERFNAFFGLGKLTWAVLPWEKLSLLMQGDPTWITNEKQSFTSHPDAESQRFQGGVKIVGTSETTLSESLFWKTQLGYGADRIHVFPMSNNFEKPGHINESTGTETINDTSGIIDTRRYRLILSSNLTYFLDNFVGDHEFKVGVEGTLAWNEDINDFPGNPEDCQAGGRKFPSCIFLDSGISRAGSTIDGKGDPFQIQVFDGPLDKTVSSNLLTAYVQDIWRPFRSLTIRPGLRFDSSRGYNDVSDGGQEVFSFNSLQPRFGVAWDPFGDGKTEVRGGYFMYNETGLLLVPQFVGRSQASTTFEFNPVTEQYNKKVAESGGDSAVIFKPGMKAPVMHELIFGVQRELWEDSVVSLDVTYRRRQNMFEDDESNIIWNAQGDDAVGFQNGEPRFIFSVGTPDGAMGQYIGLDVRFEKRLSDNWQALFTYTLSRDEGTTEDLVTYTFDNPRQAPFEYGFLLNDVRHNAKLTMSYDLPYGFIIGGTASYQSGRPDSKFFLNKFYGGFFDRRAPKGFDPKNVDDPTDDVELRLPDTFQVDARVAWRLKELTTQDIWLIADVFNVFDSRPTIAIEDRDLPPGSPTQFGQAIARGSPLTAQLAVRYLF